MWWVLGRELSHRVKVSHLLLCFSRQLHFSWLPKKSRPSTAEISETTQHTTRTPAFLGGLVLSKTARNAHSRKLLSNCT